MPGAGLHCRMPPSGRNNLRYLSLALFFGFINIFSGSLWYNFKKGMKLTIKIFPCFFSRRVLR